MIEHREVRDRHHSLSLNGGYQDELVDHLTEREWADEWKHLDRALSCIMEVAEKTRRSMAALWRCQEADREELNYWKRRFKENTEMRKTGSEVVSRQHSPGSADSLSNGKGRVSLVGKGGFLYIFCSCCYFLYLRLFIFFFERKMVLDCGIIKTLGIMNSKSQSMSRTWSVSDMFKKFCLPHIE